MTKVYTRQIGYCYECPHYSRSPWKPIGISKDVVYEECGEPELAGAGDGGRHIIRRIPSDEFYLAKSATPPDWCPLPGAQMVEK